MRPARLNDSHMPAFVSRVNLSDWQVKSYYTKGYFDKFYPIHKGTALSKQQLSTGTICVGLERSLTSTRWARTLNDVSPVSASLIVEDKVSRQLFLKLPPS